MGYFEKLMEVLDFNNTKSVEALMTEMELPPNKQTYVFKAIAKAIQKGLCTKLVTPGEKRKYLGHQYKRADPQERKAQAGAGASKA